LSERDLRCLNLFKEFEKVILEINRKLRDLDQHKSILEKDLTLLKKD